LTLICSIGIITSGPAILALSGCTRLIAQDCKVSFKEYLSGFRMKFLPGVVLSVFIAVGIASVLSSNYLLSIYENKIFVVLAVVSRTMVVLAGFFLIYYPPAAYNESKITVILLKSALFASKHVLGTFLYLGTIYLMFRIIVLASPLILFVFLPLALYIQSCFVIASNRVLERNKN
jgi:uncharacterized membrane protein YesL